MNPSRPPSRPLDMGPFRPPGDLSLMEVFDRVLDKGLVIDGEYPADRTVRVVTMEGVVVVTSREQYREFSGLLDSTEPGSPTAGAPAGSGEDASGEDAFREDAFREDRPGKDASRGGAFGEDDPGKDASRGGAFGEDAFRGGAFGKGGAGES